MYFLVFSNAGEGRLLELISGCNKQERNKGDKVSFKITREEG
jgi:hypothetical protein